MKPNKRILLTHDALMQLAFAGRTQLPNGTWIVVETISEQRARQKKKSGGRAASERGAHDDNPG